jgi:predicted alpha/beta-hydrolase family hydrolase
MSDSTFTPFVDLSADPAIHGFLHLPPRSNGNAVVLTHGAGADCQSHLLVEVSNALAAAGFTVLRFDLPFRQLRPHGPPPPGSSARDQDGLRHAIALMKEKSPGRIFVGGHSYGGRQATLLVSEEPHLVDGLLLLSYPLHPPKKPAQLRTKHFPRLTKSAFFVHGTRDPFATIAELQAALKLIPAPHTLLEIEAAAHDLLPKKTPTDLPAHIVNAFQTFVNIPAF